MLQGDTYDAPLQMLKEKGIILFSLKELDLWEGGIPWRKS